MNALRRIAFSLMAFSLTTIVVAEGSPYPDPDLYPVVCGTVSEVRVSQKSDFVLKWSIREFGEVPTLGPNDVFVEIFVTVSKGFSIGKYDFKLSGNDCLAIAEGTEPYNPENKEVVAKEGERSVKLLFIGKKAEKKKGFNLVFQYSTKDVLTDTLPEDLKALELPVISAGPAAKDEEPKEEKKTDDDKPKKKKKKPAVDGRW